MTGNSLKKKFGVLVVVLALAMAVIGCDHADKSDANPTNTATPTVTMRPIG